jgi:hypothetical protein
MERDAALHSGRIASDCPADSAPSSITVTTGTYVEVIEAVQRDVLDSMGTLFAHVGDDWQRQLSSKLSSNGSE